MFASYSMLDKLIKYGIEAVRKLKVEYQDRSLVPKLTTIRTPCKLLKLCKPQF